MSWYSEDLEDASERTMLKRQVYLLDNIDSTLIRIANAQDAQKVSDVPGAMKLYGIWHQRIDTGGWIQSGSLPLHSYHPQVLQAWINTSLHAEELSVREIGPDGLPVPEERDGGK